MNTFVVKNHRQFDYIDQEIVSLLGMSSFFSLSVVLKLLKHVKLIVFENYNEC